MVGFVHIEKVGDRANLRYWGKAKGFSWRRVHRDSVPWSEVRLAIAEMEEELKVLFDET